MACKHSRRMSSVMIGTKKTRPDLEWMHPREDVPREPFRAIQSLPNWILFAEIAFITIHGWGLFGL